MIYFFYPSKITGGVEFLFLRTILLLSKNNYDVGLIDIRNGWLSNELSKVGFTKILFLDEKVSLKSSDTLITTANLLYDVRENFHSTNAKIIFWVLHPYNVILGLPKKYENKFTKFLFDFYLFFVELNDHKDNLKKLIKSNSLVSMDHDCDRVLNNKYSITYDYVLPIFIDFNSEAGYFFDNICIDNQLNITWLGRIDLDFKIHILEKFIFDLEEYASSNPSLVFNLNIIGIGPGLNRLKGISDALTHVKVHFLGEAIGMNLNMHLKTTHLGIAMGTSAIELAYRGIPTVLLDFSFSKINCYKYRWFYEARGFELSRDISFLKDKEIQEMADLEDIIRDLILDINHISQKCKESAFDNFNGKLFLERFKNLLLEEHLSISQVNSFRRPIYKMFTKMAKNFFSKF